MRHGAENHIGKFSVSAVFLLHGLVLTEVHSGKSSPAVPVCTAAGLPQCTVLADVCSQYRGFGEELPEIKEEQLLTLPPQIQIHSPPPTFCSSVKDPAYSSV